MIISKRLAAKNVMAFALLFCGAVLHADSPDVFASPVLGIHPVALYPVFGGQIAFRRPDYVTNYRVMTKDTRIALIQKNIAKLSSNEYYDVIDRSSLRRDRNGFPVASFFGRDAYFLMGGNRVAFKFTDELESGMVYLPETARYLADRGHRAYPNGVTVGSLSYQVEGLLRYTPDNLDMTFMGEPHYGKNVMFNSANLPWMEGESGPGIGVALDIKYVFPSAPYAEYPEGTGERAGYRHLVIMNGYVDFYHPDYFYKHNRVKRVLVQSTDSGEYFEREYTLEDVPEFQVIEYPRPARSVRMIIKDVYQGTHFDDTVLSALMARGTNNYSLITDMDRELARSHYEQWTPDAPPGPIMDLSGRMTVEAEMHH